VWGKKLCNIFSFKIPDYYINQPEEENTFDFEYLNNPVAPIISESDSDN
jgi:sporulation-control protein spo0M